MPSRNTIREFVEDSYYHVYNRVVEKRLIFLDDQDYIVFLGIIKKYILGENDLKTNRHKFEKLGDKVEVLAYCLMPNHFHLLLYQKEKDGVSQLMRRVGVAYAMYFNHRYNRVGALFQGKFKTSQINADSYLHHISRYIHMNPDEFQTWPYSSLSNYVGDKDTKWLNTKLILELFDNNKSKYNEFIKDYQDNKQELTVLKWQLANDIDL